MAGHFELGEIIKNHKDTDIGKLSRIFSVMISFRNQPVLLLLLISPFILSNASIILTYYTLLPGPLL